MKKIIIKLNNKFYTKNAIKSAINAFSDICDANIISEDFIVELIPKKAKIKNLKNEFSNYVFGLIKNENTEFEYILNENNSIDNLSYKIKNKHITNFVRVKQIKDKFLLINEFGKWIILNKKEYEIFKTNNFEKNKKLYEKLIDKCIIINEKNIEKSIENAKQNKSYLFSGTSLHIIVLTKRCTINCLYCQTSAQSSKKDKNFDLDIDNAKKFVDIIFQSPSKQLAIEFQGGEPLLNFETLKFIVEYTNEKNISKNKIIQFTVVSNLTNVSDDILNYLSNNKIKLCTSLDGPKEIHNACRDKYSTVIKNIKKAKKIFKKNIKNSEFKKYHINALLTITRKSLNKHKEIIDEYIKNGFTNISLRPVNNFGNTNENKDLICSPEEFIDFWKKAVDYIIELNKNGKYFFEGKSRILLEKIFNNKTTYTDLRSPCGAIIGQLLYNYDGKIFTCDEGRMIDEDVFMVGNSNNTYEQIINSNCACNMISASINDTLYCDKCIYKPFCGICPVINYAENGSLVNNIPSSFWCKIHMAQFDYIFEKLENKENAKIFKKWIGNKKIPSK
ncbi:MAG: His-Xaa-Ser system radical SAM maturase HxsB [Candidatus Woesearchaeota archaeon]